MPDARYQLAQVPEDPVHRTPAYTLEDVLTILGGQHSLRCRLAPFFVFQEGEPRARGIWCPVCGRLSWNPGDVLNWYCGYCHKFYRA
jgi:hypothetical protein